MRLKRLELFGFKSFADRSVLDFAHGVVGIVGPNGCGKSNVVDAVRWVLGEQRPTSMRGGEMVDVIFKGSTSRPALSVAEATLVFDNAESRLADRGPEVSVTRRVFRSGEGEYLIDGDKVRLKDVREMLYGTGLGSRGYSVLEQGKIDAVLSANPLERRSIFEEAAGISRYRQRHKEVESRLKRVEADLLRLDDVLGELDKRQRSLKVQAGRAQRFLEVREAWREAAQRYARHRLHDLDARIGEERRTLAELEGEAEEERRRRSAAEGELALREQELAALAGEVERLAEEASREAGELRALDERRSQLAARIASWDASGEEERERAATLARKLDERRGQLAAVARDAEALDAEAEAGRERLATSAAGLAAARAAAQRLAEALEARNELVLGALAERTSAQNAIHHLDQGVEALAARARRADDRLTEAEANLTTAVEGESEAVLEVQRREETLEELEARRARLGAEVEALAADALELEREKQGLELESARLSSRVETLRDREAEREGLEQGAQGLLRGIESGEGPALAGRVGGLLADFVTTDTRHARALDAALGQRAQALFVQAAAGPAEDDASDPAADARAVLAWLKEREKGRAELVFPAGLARTLRRGDAAEAVGAFDGRPAPRALLELCRVAPGCGELATTLLEGVFLAQDLEHALAAVRRFPRARFVTPEGDLVDAAGVSGGHAEVARGPVGRRSTAAELEEEHGRVAAALERAAAGWRDASRRREETRLSFEALRGAIEAESDLRARARGAAETARARVADLAQAVEVSRHEREVLAAEEARLSREREEAVVRLAAARERMEHEEAQLAELEAEQRASREEIARLAEEEARSRIEARGVEERRDAAVGRRADLERVTQETGDEHARAERLATEHARLAREAREESERLATTRLAVLARRGELDERVTEMRARERGGREAIEALRRSGESLTGALEARLARISERRLEEQRLTLAREEIVRRAEEDFHQGAVELLAGFEPEPELADPAALDALGEQVAELKRSLERLGPVNLEAVGELDEVSQRLGFLTEQRRDLDQARATLDSTLRRLDDESVRLFLETFAEVRENFHTIFRQLFGGGKADIALQEGAPVLEAGIEITARPPGREMLPISLLSGGQRTMTALALLFSVFQARPSPFCVLDEVDAALDDANIGRFLALLAATRRDTQFVIVTHNKGTMSACDLLYGVTMAVRGVSKVVSVELSEVDEIVPEAVGPGDRPSAEDAVPAAGPARPADGARDEATAGGEPVVELIPHRSSPARSS